MNPINIKEIKEKSKEPIEEELKHNGIIICAVGRLAYEKGYDRLLKVHRKLLREHIENTIWIVGEGVERDRLQETLDRVLSRRYRSINWIFSEPI